MATFLLVGLVTMLPLLEEQAAQAGPSKIKVFLADARGAQIQSDCAAVVATALTARIAETKGVVPARSAADADVVVRVKECRAATSPRVGGEIGVSTTIAGPGRYVRGGAAVAVSRTTVSRVILVVDDQGKPVEFASEPAELPLPEAARTTTGSLLTWIEKKNAH